MPCGPSRAGGSVFPCPGLVSLESASPSPLAFTIADSTNCLAAGRAAQARRWMHRLQGWFIAPRPVAHGRGQNNFCCVTTRRCNLRILRGLWQRWGTLTARTLILGVLGFGGLALASSRLPPRRLPTTEQTPAFGVLAVTLVPTSWLVLATTAFAQAHPRPWSSRTGTAAAFWTIMTAAHGSLLSQGIARGERAYVLLGR
jgi:hypothetical protein